MDETLHEASATEPQGIRSYALPVDGDIVGDRFRVERRVGKGGMGAVFEATDLTTYARVAIKSVNWGDESVAGQVIGRMKREARVVSRIVSPNVVRLIDDGLYEHGDMPFLAMELLQGEDLQRVLSRIKGLHPQAVIKIGLQAARGLAASHACGVVHRDVKPPNLFLATTHHGDELVVKLLDFGIARPVNEPGARATQGLTATGTIIGSPIYMSPEQIQGEIEVTPAVDVWALWVTLYQLLTGRTPHELESGSAVGSLLVKICATPAPPITKFAPWLPQALALAVMRGLDLQPEKRFQSAAEVEAELTRLLGDEDQVLRASDLFEATTSLQAASAVPPAPTDGFGAPSAQVQAPDDGPAVVGWAASGEQGTVGPELVRTGSTGRRHGFAIGAAATACAGLLVLALFARFVLATMRAGEHSTSASAAPAAPALVSTKPLEAWVRVPDNVTIELNGRAIAPEGNRIKVTGTNRSMHRLVLKRAHITKEVMVVLGQDGAFPAEVDFPSLGVTVPTVGKNPVKPK